MIQVAEGSRNRELDGRFIIMVRVNFLVYFRNSGQRRNRPRVQGGRVRGPLWKVEAGELERQTAWIQSQGHTEWSRLQ